jgi:very-short-patch-repair endonuclease
MSQRSMDENPGCSSLFSRKPKQKQVPQSVIQPETEINYGEYYRLAQAILTDNEVNFYRVANEILKGKYVICPQVSLSVLINVEAENNSIRQSAFNKINSKYIDFLVCDAVTMKPIYAIELDDSSHNRKDRKERDEFLNQVFEKIGFPLIRIASQTAYLQSDLAAKLLQPLQNLLTPMNPHQAEYENSSRMPNSQVVPSRQLPTAFTQVEKICQKCGAPMKIRKADTGSQIGKEYWVCTKFPKCQNFFPVEKGQ